MATGFGIGFLDRWKSDWIDPALNYIEGRPKTDSHLNEASNEYSEEEIKASTKNFDPSCLLGSGTFGSVYRGTMNDGTEVAIKVLHVPEEAGFEEEVQVLSRFRHPNLVILMGFARHEEGWRSLIYEFLAGSDVSKRIQRSRQQLEPFKWKARLSAAVDAACGLSHLHHMTPRAFHRDIKGPNILLDKNGTAKMADFGLSCVSEGAQHKVKQASGTVGYACPEYIRTGIITEGSEVHSFGMVLLELLTGAPPAVEKPNRPGEFNYLVDHIQGSKAKVIGMLDESGQFPVVISQALTDVSFRCIRPNPVERPLFKMLVDELRDLYLSSPAEPGDADVTRDHRESQREKAPPAVRRVLLSVGTVVTSRWRGGTSWLRGRIIHINRDGTFKIQYDHGEIEPNVPALNIRAVDLPAVPRRDKEEGYGPPPPPPPPRRETPRPPPRPKSVAPPNPDRNDRNDPPWLAQPNGHAGLPGARGEHLGDLLDPSAVPPYRLWCVYAEGVDLGKLTAQQRSLSSNLPELVVGRTAQPAAVWETLVPDKRFHATISREHLKVIARQGSQGAQASFSVACLSLNGVMLNGHFIGNDSGERPLQHGDALAFATVVDVMAPIENQSRKPFVVLQFEVLGPSPAAEALPTAYPSSPRLRSAPVKGPFDDLEDRKELLHPPPGMVAGRWRTSPTAEGPPDALFCLELHGNELRPGLPAEARQLFFCCDSQARPSRLRVGRYYQRHLWENILSEEILTGGTLWAAMMAQDHFEIAAIRRNNPQLAEPPDWRFRLRVLSAAGVVLNYSIMCTAGDERELSPSDTLTVKRPHSRASTKPAISDSCPPGLHLTFIPLVGPLVSLGPPSPEQDGDVPQLPELSDSDTEDRRAPGHDFPVGVGVLQPPTGVLHLQRDSSDEEEAEAQAEEEDGSFQGRIQTAKTRILEAPVEGDPDDLFARTGFRAGDVGVEEELPDPPEDLDGTLSLTRRGHISGSWLPSFSC
ncbi:unnamed protein product [Durusdinium trenchii]|uniref:non-specific serine/threonine protein kinase n=3 Tax=Durusdinium trenchii TaxID=1381693 RepID=A0ABP0LDR4_9DINO